MIEKVQGNFNGHIELTVYKLWKLYFIRQRTWTTTLNKPDYTKPYFGMYKINLFDFEIGFKIPATIHNFLRRIFFPRPGEKKDWKSLIKQHTKDEIFK
jgi:hypothetical protein